MEIGKRVSDPQNSALYPYSMHKLIVRVKSHKVTGSILRTKLGILSHATGMGLWDPVVFNILHRELEYSSLAG